MVVLIWRLAVQYLCFKGQGHEIECIPKLSRLFKHTGTEVSVVEGKNRMVVVFEIEVKMTKGRFDGKPIDDLGESEFGQHSREESSKGVLENTSVFVIQHAQITHLFWLKCHYGRDYFISRGFIEGAHCKSVEAYEKAGRSVTWIDDDDEEHPTAASADITRIIRAEYSDHTYRNLAEKSLGAFKTRQPYSKYFHHTGWLLIQDEQQARHGSVPRGAKNVSVEEFRRKFPAANIDDDSIITRTENVGWVEANNLQQAINAEARAKKRRLGEAVVLATGWRTNRLLAHHNVAKHNL